MGGSGERAARPGTGGYPEDPLGSPAGSPTSGYPTAPATGSDTGRYSSGGHSSGGYSTGGYSSGGYSTGGYSTGGYATGGYSTGGYSQSGGSGQYSSGGQAPGGYEQGGGYGRDSGSGGYPTGGYPRTGGASGHEADPGRYAAGPPSSDDHAYARGSQAARTQGPRDTREPRDPRDTRDPRDSSGRGGYRSGTGSHRVVREERRGRRWGIVLVGAFAGIAACVLAVFVVVSGTGSDGTDGTGRIVGSGASESASAGTSEFSGVPDSCTIVGTDLIDRLAPDAERNEADNYQGNDRQTQCVWGVYAGDQKRQLTIELRAIEAAGGATATATAQRTYASEQKVDEAGEALLEGQELADKRRLDGVGDEGYVVYSVDGQHGSGEAIANVRHANVLVTIHYTGSDGEDPLSYETAGDGAVEAAEAVLAKLKES
ncbi:hypothetical protein [Actinomadura sp. WMMB 499]|uniref:hypothetical protein n=1 Tax=Actinomadura sp. WMMB 499 TaxID=1219491 RepID=UPI0012464F79|nr:hypothetical protein [Actinomadura sp. WMMB 499]QFG23958.1 hypothetical protein F7P10_25370 [Actinomadura sp. WMMB 499]